MSLLRYTQTLVTATCEIRRFVLGLDQTTLNGDDDDVEVNDDSKIIIIKIVKTKELDDTNKTIYIIY